MHVQLTQSDLLAAERVLAISLQEVRRHANMFLGLHAAWR